MLVKSTWDHIWPKTESMAYCALLWHYSGHKAHNTLPASRVFNSMSEQPVHTKPHCFRIFSPYMPLSDMDFSLEIPFTLSGELNHSDVIPPCMGHFEIKDLLISADPEQLIRLDFSPSRPEERQFHIFCKPEKVLVLNSHAILPDCRFLMQGRSC